MFNQNLNIIYWQRYFAIIPDETIIFHFPKDTSQDYIKRIIGLPGETIEIADCRVKINSQIMVEDYLLPAMRTLGEVEVTLGQDEYYFLGDNRTSSLDSRAFGVVRRQDIIGRTLLRGWPVGRFGLILNDLEYNFN